MKGGCTITIVIKGAGATRRLRGSLASEIVGAAEQYGARHGRTLTQLIVGSLETLAADGACVQAAEQRRLSFGEGEQPLGEMEAEVREQQHRRRGGDPTQPAS